MKTIDEWYQDFREYRETYELSTSLFRTLTTFKNWCHSSYPNELFLTQELIDEWGSLHEKETGTTHASRIATLNSFLKYINDRGGTFRLVEPEPMSPYNEPRCITEDEFTNILKAADEIHIWPEGHRFHLNSMIAGLEMPVILRLLFSSGVRIPEVRWLARKDADLQNGILYIRKGKGYKERIVALHPQMNRLMIFYDLKMEELIPNRVPFFPNVNGDFIGQHWIALEWRQLFDKYNVISEEKEKEEEGGKRTRPVQYSLRHKYIIENIEKLPQDGYQRNIRLIAISQSVGHVSIENTIKYYYHLSPRSGDLLDAKMGKTFDNIIPDLEEDSNIQ